VRCGEVAPQTLKGFGGRECGYNFCDMARTLRMGENAFCRPLLARPCRPPQRPYRASGLVP
jgi:hypothetical protein